MKKLLLVLALFLAGLLALKLLLSPSPGQATRAAIPLVRKSAQGPPSPKHVCAVPAPPAAHSY